MPEWSIWLLTYLAINLLIPRVTLTQANRLQITLCGALLGVLAIPPMRALAGSDDKVLFSNGLFTLLAMAVLLLPALAVLDGRQRPRLSVSDGFLLGFLPAFGYDALSRQLLDPGLGRLGLGPSAVGLLPPDASGFAWACGLVTLAWAAAYRLSLLEGYAQFWATCALIWAVVDRLRPWPLYVKYVSAYNVLPWATLVLVFWMAWLERIWVHRSPGSRQLEGLNVLRVPSLGDALKEGPPGLLARERGLGLRAGLILERTEMLERGRNVMGELPTAYRVEPLYPDPLGWGLRAAALLLGGLILIEPSSLYVLLGGLVAVALYLRSTDLDLDEANSMLGRLGHQMALHGAMLSAVLVLWYPAPEKGWLARCLALGLVAASLQDPLRRDWALFLEPYQRRLSVLHRALTLALTLGLCFMAARLYAPWRELMAGLVGRLTDQPGMLVHFVTALTLGSLLVVAALVGGRLAATVEEGFDLAGRRSAE